MQRHYIKSMALAKGHLGAKKMRKIPSIDLKHAQEIVGDNSNFF